MFDHFGALSIKGLIFECYTDPHHVWRKSLFLYHSNRSSVRTFLCIKFSLFQNPGFEINIFQNPGLKKLHLEKKGRQLEIKQNLIRNIFIWTFEKYLKSDHRHCTSNNLLEKFPIIKYLAILWGWGLSYTLKCLLLNICLVKSF